MKNFNRINITIFSILLFGVFPAFSQDGADWDSTYRPSVYGPLIERFQFFPPQKEDMVFLGNSITFWGDWNQRFPELKIRNQGIPGDITFGVLNRINEAVRGKPSKVFILIGINGLARHIPVETIVKNYARIMDSIQIKSPGTEIIWQTQLPTNGSFHILKNHYHRGGDVRRINMALKDLAKSKEVKLIDLHASFVDSIGELRKEYTWDGVHLNQKGYFLWENILRKGNYL